MRSKLNRWWFAAAFAAAVVAVGWLFVDASSPLALGAEVLEGGWRIANSIPLLLSALLTNREHDIPALIAIPLMLCWWFAIGLALSHRIWGRHDDRA